ncbi:MAG: hypothetical protein BWX67_01496 [Thermotogae bacterium ADurb.Bin062]|nr:MAG: hypothetical protein BWX67_01496 [Thermotogota bacterium ADurb.Bin062]
MGTADLTGYRGVSGFYDPAIRSLSFPKGYRAVARRRVAYAAMSVGLSRGNQRDPAIPLCTERLRRDVVLGNANF